MVDADISALGHYPDMARYFLQQFKDMLTELTTLNAHGESSIAAGRRCDAWSWCRAYKHNDHPGRWF